MHILKIIHGYPPAYNAGSEVYTAAICGELAKQYKVSVFCREENPYQKEFSLRREKVSPNLQFFRVNMAQTKDGFIRKEVDSLLANIVEEFRPDIAHIGHLNHLSMGIVDALARAKIPMVYTLHDFWLMCPRGQFLQRKADGSSPWQLCCKQENEKCATTCYRPYFTGLDENFDRNYWTEWVKRRMEQSRKLVQKVQLFIAPSRYLRQRFIQDFDIPESKIIYLDYGFGRFAAPTEAAQNPERHFTFGYIGTHIPAKGINLLLEAFNKITQKCRLIIYGRESAFSTAYLKAMAQNAPNEVVFAGEYCNNQIAAKVFQEVDCIVVPSVWAENSPLVIHEAQAHKIPVITADLGGMQEYVQHKVNGLLFSHRSAEDLYEKLCFALQNPEWMRQLGQRGYLYSPTGQVPCLTQHCQTLAALYRQLINA
jgi:glycosyltransferase involved in cell wall biosynthesis